MIRMAVPAFVFLTLAGALAGLQACFHYIPIHPPHLWLIIFAYVCFTRSLAGVALFNIGFAIILSQFSILAPFPIIVSLNVVTLLVKLIQNRIQLTDVQRILFILPLGLAFDSTMWITQLFNESSVHNLYQPYFLAWLTANLSNLLLSPLIYFPIQVFDNWFLKPEGKPLEPLTL